MTEERKQELRGLLEEAIHCFEIRPRLDSAPNPRSIAIDEYKALLRKRWESHSDESLRFLIGLVPYISSDVTRWRLFDFIREELAPFIQNDAILTPSHFLKGYFSEGFPIERLITQLLKFAIARDTEGAVSEMDRCLRFNRGSFKQLALLEGIRLEKEIEVFDGVRLVPLSSVESERPSYMPNVSRSMPGDFFFGKTLLVIDCCISPIFHKPMKEHSDAGLEQGYLDPRNRENPFRVEVHGRDSTNFSVNDRSVNILCHALSLTCNRPVQVSFERRFLEESELFNLSSGIFHRSHWRIADSGEPRMVGETEIYEAKHLYNDLKANSEVRKALWIPIDRWVKSKVPGRCVDSIIDLGIAFETLYLLDTDSKSELSFRLRLRAAWHLGKDEEDRKQLLTKFKNIYEGRSKAVHSGKLKETLEFGGEKISRSEFIAQTQDLCRESIMKVLEDGRFPDWDNLMLGGEAERVGN